MGYHCPVHGDYWTIERPSDPRMPCCPRAYANAERHLASALGATGESR